MNRRAFLRGLATVGIAIAVPANVIKAFTGPEPLRDSASMYLTKAWNAYMKGKSSKSAPKYIVAGRDLFQGISQELTSVQRFVLDSRRSMFEEQLLFKSAVLVSDSRSGWHYRFYQDEKTAFVSTLLDNALASSDDLFEKALFEGTR